MWVLYYMINILINSGVLNKFAAQFLVQGHFSRANGCRWRRSRYWMPFMTSSYWTVSQTTIPDYHYACELYTPTTRLSAFSNSLKLFPNMWKCLQLYLEVTWSLKLPRKEKEHFEALWHHKLRRGKINFINARGGDSSSQQRRPEGKHIRANSKKV